MFKGQHCEPECLKWMSLPGERIFFLLPSFSGRCVNDLALHIAHARVSSCLTVLTWESRCSWDIVSSRREATYELLHSFLKVPRLIFNCWQPGDLMTTTFYTDTACAGSSSYCCPSSNVFWLWTQWIRRESTVKGLLTLGCIVLLH